MRFNCPSCGFYTDRDVKPKTSDCNQKGRMMKKKEQKKCLMHRFLIDKIDNLK